MNKFVKNLETRVKAHCLKRDDTLFTPVFGDIAYPSRIGLCRVVYMYLAPINIYFTFGTFVDAKNRLRGFRSACALAAGVTDEKNICMIAGTWSINEYIRRNPVTDGRVLMNSLFCLPGYYLVEESSPHLCRK